MQSKHDEMRGSVPANVCQRAKHFAGGGALERGDLRLFEDCSELGGTLVSDVVDPQTVSEEHRADIKRVKRGDDSKANTLHLSNNEPNN